MNHAIKLQLHKKLTERLQNPKVPKDKLSGFENVYKIKLKTIGYRLVYKVIDDRLVVYVVSIGRRENHKVYESLNSPFQHTGLAVVLQGLVRPRLRGTELEFWRNSEEARTDRPSQQLRSLNGEWRLMRYFLLTHLCGISHRIWCTLSTICSDAA
nr:type II toxin-antitoxin system RelE/ParE family toxin [Chrysiogenes arsenatis]